MTNYLLDTSICIYLFRGRKEVAEKLQAISSDNCFISDVTLAELYYGAYKSASPEKNKCLIDSLVKHICVVPLQEYAKTYAQEKNILRQSGTLIEDFDLLIAAAAKYRGYTLVTDNLKHFERVQGLTIENWINR